MANSNVPEATHFIDICDKDVNLGLGDFDDQRVFAVSNAYFDRRKAGVFWSNSFAAFQTFDEPTFIVVGAEVPDERLARNLSNLGRYGVTLEQLQTARRDEVVQIR